MPQLQLDRLLHDRHPFGSFHDGVINRLDVDFLAREARFHVGLCVADPDASDDDPTDLADGVLILTGLLYIVLEPPRVSQRNLEDGVLITADGPIETAQFRHAIPELPKNLPDDAFQHYFFLHDWNCFLFVGATGARFTWDD